MTTPTREKVIAELKNGPLAHLPSGVFNANAAWLVLAAISFNLTRAAGTLASRFHARATTATIRTHLNAVSARIARSARRLHLHLKRPKFPAGLMWAVSAPPSQGLTAWTPGRSPNFALASRDTTVRPCSRACAAMMRSCASRGVPVRRT